MELPTQELPTIVKFGKGTNRNCKSFNLSLSEERGQDKAEQRESDLLKDCQTHGQYLVKMRAKDHKLN
jgi:hypothetical protein